MYKYFIGSAFVVFCAAAIAIAAVAVFYIFIGIVSFVAWSLPVASVSPYIWPLARIGCVVGVVIGLICVSDFVKGYVNGGHTSR